MLFLLFKAVKNFLGSTWKENIITITKASDPLPEVRVEGPLRGRALAARSFFITAMAKVFRIFGFEIVLCVQNLMLILILILMSQFIVSNLMRFGLHVDEAFVQRLLEQEKTILIEQACSSLLTLLLDLVNKL